MYVIKYVCIVFVLHTYGRKHIDQQEVEEAAQQPQFAVVRHQLFHSPRCAALLDVMLNRWCLPIFMSTCISIDCHEETRIEQ